MPGLVPTLSVLENSDLPWAYVHSAETRRCKRILIKIHSVDMGHPLAVDSLLDSGATGMFIDIEYVRHTLYHVSYLFTTLMEHPKRSTLSAHLELRKCHIFGYQSGETPSGAITTIPPEQVLAHPLTKLLTSFSSLPPISWQGAC